jgi:hypothetical protein
MPAQQANKMQQLMSNDFIGFPNTHSSWTAAS